MTDDEVLEFALTTAKGFEPGPTSISYVRGPMVLINPYAQDRAVPITPSTEPRDVAHPHLVLLKFGGEFTALRAHRRHGPPPTGTEAHFLLDEPPQTLMGWWVSRRELDLAQIGTPVRLRQLRRSGRTPPGSPGGRTAPPPHTEPARRRR